VADFQPTPEQQHIIVDLIDTGVSALVVAGPGMARDEAAYDAVVLALAAMRDMSISPSELNCRKAAVAMLAMNTSWNPRLKRKLGQVEKLAKGLKSVKVGDGSPFGELLKDIVSGIPVAEQVASLGRMLANLDEFKVAAGRISSHGQLGRNVVLAADSQLSLFDSVRATRAPKGLDGYDAWRGKTHLLTYHKAKGREFDFVVLVVDPRAESGKSPLDEKRRLYYVAATRAKKWLGVLYFGKDHGLVLGPVLAK
jgi:superfamily I DNA/RNA helicase